MDIKEKEDYFLSRLIKKGVAEKRIDVNGVMLIPHLVYAEDVLVFIKANWCSISVLMRALHIVIIVNTPGRLLTLSATL